MFYWYSAWCSSCHITSALSEFVNLDFYAKHFGDGIYSAVPFYTFIDSDDVNIKRLTLYGKLLSRLDVVKRNAYVFNDADILNVLSKLEHYGVDNIIQLFLDSISDKRFF